MTGKATAFRSGDPENKNGGEFLRRFEIFSL